MWPPVAALSTLLLSRLLLVNVEEILHHLQNHFSVPFCLRGCLEEVFFFFKMVPVTNVMNRVRVNEKFEFYQKTSSIKEH